MTKMKVEEADKLRNDYLVGNYADFDTAVNRAVQRIEYGIRRRGLSELKHIRIEEWRWLLDVTREGNVMENNGAALVSSDLPERLLEEARRLGPKQV